MIKLYDESIEKSIIGSIVSEGNKLLEEIIGILEDKDFYKTENQKCYEILQDIYRKNIPIDLATIAEYLDKNKITADVTLTYLTHCMNMVPNIANLHYYVKVIKDYSYKRTVLKKINDFQIDKTDTQQLVEDIVNIPKYEEVKEKSNKEIILETIDDAQKGTDFRFGETFEDINSTIGGIDKGDLIIIGGYPSNGKSSLMVNFAVDFCQDEKKVLICTLEMPPKAIMRRILAHNNWINTKHFRDKNGLTEDDKKKIKSNIEIIDKIWTYNCVRTYTIPDIIRAISKYKPDVVFIDFLQSIGGDDDLSYYAQRTKHVMEIQRLAKQHNATIFLLSQFNRPQDGKIVRPHNNNLRDSGAIEERADIIFLIYWERKLKMESLYRRDGDNPEYIELNITKNRDGETGGLKYNFYPEYHRWTNPEEDNKEPIMYNKAEEVSRMHVKERENTIF